jgi:hypothetical protein
MSEADIRQCGRLVRFVPIVLQKSQKDARLISAKETIPSTPGFRRERLKLQVALITPLIHVKGYAAQETRAAVDRANLLIEQGEAMGEPPEDPLLLFSVLYGISVANYVAFNAEALRETATQLLRLSERQAPTVLVIAHRLMGHCSLLTGKFTDARRRYDQALALYDPKVHRSLALRFGQDPGIAVLAHRSWVLWLLGYPDAALADTRTHA